jgi:hypothetical protein
LEEKRVIEQTIKNWKSVRIDEITIFAVESDVEGKLPWLCAVATWDRRGKIVKDVFGFIEVVVKRWRNKMAFR